MEATSEHPSSATDAQNFLTYLQKENLNKLDADGEADDSRNWTMNYIRDIKRDLSNPSQVLPELLQNADDVDGDISCDNVVIQLTESSLRIWNDGRSMTENEVQSLCGLGESTKRLADQDFIGHFGRGFKSVFNIAETVTVRSGYFEFSLDDDRLVVPQDISAPDGKFTGTEIILPFKKDLDSTDRNRLESRVKSIERLLPYLQRVSTITLNLFGDVTIFEKEDHANSNEITIYRDGKFDESRKLFESRGIPTGKARREIIEHRDLDAPSGADLETKVLVSVRVDEDGNPTPDLDRSRLFNYLPTQERPQLPFDVQADFLLDSNRESLHDSKSAYNQWLLRKTGDAFRNLVEHYKKSSARDAHLRVIPTNNRFEEVREAVCESISEMECIPITTETEAEYVEPDQIVVPSERLRSAIDASSISELIGREISYPAEDIDSGLIDNIVEIELLSEYNIENAVEDCRNISTTTESLDRRELLKFVTAIDEYKQNEFVSYGSLDGKKKKAFESTVAELELIPIKGDERRAFADLESNPMIPSNDHRESLNLFSDSLPILNLSLDRSVADTDASANIPNSNNLIQKSRRAYENLFEFSKLTPTQAIKRVVEPAFENVDKYDDDTLNEYLAFIFTNRDRWDAAETHLGGSIHLKTRNGNYVNPAETPIFYPDSYGGEYSRETLLESTNAVFLSEQYLRLGDSPEPVDDERKSRCREFFGVLQVRDRLYANFEDRSARTLHTEQELRNYLDDIPVDIEIPDSLSSTVIGWMGRHKYAIKDANPSPTFDQVLTALDEGAADYQAGVALAKMIDTYWDEYEDAFDLHLNYVYRGRYASHEVGETKIDARSSFGKRVTNASWFPTDDGSLAPPASLLTEDTVSTGDIPVSRCGYAPKPNCREAIGISKTLGWQKAISVLETASNTWGDRSPSNIKSDIIQLLGTVHTEWINASQDRRQEIINKLENTRFIYVEDASPQFRKPDDVALADSGLGDFLVAADETYRRYRDLLKTVGAVEEIGLNEHLDYLNNCENVADINQIATVWPRTIGYLDDVFLDESGTNDDIREKLNSEQCLLTQSDTFASLSDLKYYCYDEELLTHLDDQQVQTETVGAQAIGTPGKTWPEMWENLGLRDLSSYLKQSAVSEIDPETDASTWASTSEVGLEQLLNVVYSYVLSESKSNKCEEKISKIATNYTIQSGENIELRYVQPCSKSPVTESFTVQSFIDIQTETIHIGEGIDAQYDFAERLSHYLSGSLDNPNALANLLTGALGKSDKHLQAYLDDHDLPYEAFRIENQEMDKTDNQSNDSESSDSQSSSTASIDTDSDESVTEESRETSGAEASTQIEDTPSGSDDGALAVDQNTNDSQSSVANHSPSSQSRSGNNKPLRNDSSTTQSTESVTETSPQSSEVDSDVESLSNYSAGKTDEGSDDSKEQSTSQKVSDSDTAETTLPNPVPISDVIDSSDNEIAPTWGTGQESASGSGSNGGGGGGGGGGGTVSGGKTAVSVGKWGEDYIFVRFARYLRNALPGDSISEEWHWGGVHPKTSNTVKKAQSDGGNFECPVDGSMVEGIQFTGDELQCPVTIFYIGKCGLGADMYIHGAAVRQSSNSGRIELRDTGDEEQTWIEVKSTQAPPQERTEVEFHPNEYQRAHLEDDAYLIIRVCNAMSDNVVINRIFSSLAHLERDEKVSVSGDLTLEF